MKTLHLPALYLLFALLFHQSSIAQRSNWTNITTPYYLYAFAESKQSYWFAHSGGLFEVDKTTFQTKPHLPYNSNIKGCKTTGVVVNDQDEVFISTEYGGIYKYNGSDWTQVQSQQIKDYHKFPTSSLKIDRNNNLWFIGNEFKNQWNYAIFQIKAGKDQIVQHKFTIDGLSCIEVDRNAQVWAANRQSIYRFGEDKVEEALDISKIKVEESEGVRGLYFDSKNILYINTIYSTKDHFTGFRIIKYSNGEFSELWNSRSLESGFKYSSIYMHNDSFYLHTYKGMTSYLSIISEGKISKIPRENIGLSKSQYLFTIIGVDMQKNFVYQTYDTLKKRNEIYIEKMNRTVSLLQQAYPFYSNGSESIEKDINSMWVVNGSKAFQNVNNEWILRDNDYFNLPWYYDCEEVKIDPTGNKQYFVFKDISWSYWIKIIGNDFVKSINEKDLIFDLQIGNDDLFIYRSNQVLHIYNKDKHTEIKSFSNDIYEKVSRIFLDNENGIWITTYSPTTSDYKLYFLNGEKLELKTFPYIVNCTFKHADQQGNLIGLGYGIIYKYSIKDGSLKLFTELQPNIGIYDIKEGDDGYYWLGTSNGVYRWDGEKEFLNWNIDNAPLLDPLVKKITFDHYNNLWLMQSYGITIFNPNGLNNTNNYTRYQFQGQIYFDQNKNGKREVDLEPLLPNRTLNLAESKKSYFTRSGSYNFFCNDIDQTISPKLESGEEITSLSKEYVITKNNYKATSFDFGIWAKYPVQNVEIDVFSSRTRCLSEKKFIIQILNKNPIKTIQNVEFILDEKYTNISSNKPIDRRDMNSLYWDKIEIGPFESVSIEVTATAPSAQVSDNNLYNEVVVTDYVIFENQIRELVKDSLFCSLDPNDKIQSFYGEARASESLKSNAIKYTIRFQNTGNDTAYTIYIMDTLDASLDINTFELINSSHTCNVEIIDNRIVKFLFKKIYLTFQKQNDLASQGFVSYRIKAKSDIANKTKIQNTASIYFDLNEPIHTNTTKFTAVDYFPKELQPKFYNSILVTPNPSKDLINIEFDENAVFQIYNQSGQFILSTKDKTIDISNFTSGVYSIYSFTATGQKVSKLFEKIR